MLLWTLVGCLYKYNPVKYEIGSLPDTYMTSPSNRTDYCELGFAYAEGFTVEEAKNAVYQYVRSGDAAAIVDLRYNVIPLSDRLHTDAKGRPVAEVYAASGVLVEWGPCR